MTTTEGLTPFLYAARLGKMVSFWVLLNDRRVDIDRMVGVNLTALDLITVWGEVPFKAKELFAKLKKTPLDQEDNKLAIIIVNNEYRPYTEFHKGIWDDLPGAKIDATDMKARMEVYGYKVIMIKNDPDILGAIKRVMNMTPVSSVSYLQLLFLGE